MSKNNRNRVLLGLKGRQNRSEAFAAVIGTSAESKGVPIVGYANLQPQTKAWITSSRGCNPERDVHYRAQGISNFGLDIALRLLSE